MSDQDLDQTQDNLESPETPPTVDPQEILQLLNQVEREIAQIRQMLTGVDQLPAAAGRRKVAVQATTVDPEGARIIEGVFDGQNMVGPDGKQYSVPANYASKSKLVEGDVLKLTITRDGSFIYKQIGPVERQRLIGQLVRDETTGEYRVTVGNDSYKLLLASITYFKGEVGDEVVILVPQAGEARWAAVENIIKTVPAAEVAA